MFLFHAEIFNYKGIQKNLKLFFMYKEFIFSDTLFILNKEKQYYIAEVYNCKNKSILSIGSLSVKFSSNLLSKS